MRKKGIPEVLDSSAISMYQGAKTRDRVDSELSEQFEVGIHHRICVVTFFFAVMVDVVTEFTREGALSELLYADDLLMISETINGLMNKFRIWKEAFESNGLKIGKTKVMFSGGIAKDGLSKIKVYPCVLMWVLQLESIMTHSILCVLCCKWIHGRSAGVNSVPQRFLKLLLAESVLRILEGQWSRKKSYWRGSGAGRKAIGGAVEQEEKLLEGQWSRNKSYWRGSGAGRKAIGVAVEQEEKLLEG